MAALTPQAALSPEGFYSLYLGGLAIENETRRREACFVLLGLGRLGLRPTELTHLHDGWIDWARGEVHVPARDPCACSQCYARAREQTADTETEPESLLGEVFWSPPDGEAATRTIAFGWSQRLTAAMEAITGAEGYLDTDESGIEGLVETAAENAWELDPETVSVPALRATAATFLARAGFGPRRLAEVLVIEEATAGSFARVGGGELRNHLYRALPQADAPDICAGETAYRLVCDPDPFDREPFDPRTYDVQWRGKRAEKTSTSERNLRPTAPELPDSFDLETEGIREPTGDSGPQLVSQSLADWVERRESQRTQYAETGSPGMADAPDRSVAYRDQVTAPVEYSFSTRFAGQGIEQSRPTGGLVVLGQREFVFLSRDETGIADRLRIPFSAVVDVAPGYVPGPLKGLFDETIGIAYRDEHDERKVVVCELPDGQSWELQQTLFSLLIDDVPVLYANLSEGDDPDAIEPERRRCSVSPRTLKIAGADAGVLAVRIQLSTIVGIEEKPMESEVGYEMGLTLHHLRLNANVVTAEIRAIDDRQQTFLKRYLTAHHERQKRKARNTSLSEEQRAVLDALQDAGDGRDLVAILDMNPSRVSNVVQSLKAAGLVRDSRTGVALTGTGYLVTSGGTLLYESTE